MLTLSGILPISASLSSATTLYIEIANLWYACGYDGSLLGNFAQNLRAPLTGFRLGH